MPLQPTKPSGIGTGRRSSAGAALRRAILVAPLVLTGCSGVLDPRGPVGQAQRTILIDSLAIMLAIILPTIAATLGFAWWYRAGNTKAEYKADWAYSGRIELITWSIPLLTIMLLSGVIWIGSHDLDPGKPITSVKPTLEVQVVSMDFKWLFIYPDRGIASVNKLVVPAGAPLHFTLTSSSVMNSFFVPQLGSQIYTMNGMATQLNLMADEPGSYYGLATHLSGDGFSDMDFNLVAVSDNEFDAWVEGARKDGPTLDSASYNSLAEQSMKVQPFTYRDAEPLLFQKVVMQLLPPGPGPKAGADPSVFPHTEH